MKKILITVLFVLGVLIAPLSVSAAFFDLIGPTEQLVRGQDVRFTVNIDTEGKSLSSISTGMTYETQYLEYVSTLPGNTFTTVSADVQDGGKLVITGTSTTPYSGSGIFAYVTFKLIATGPGATELCTLFNPTEIPTATPQPPGQPTYTPYPTSPPGQPTYTPYPTSLPKSGETGSATKGIVLAFLFFITAAGGFLVFKKT